MKSRNNSFWTIKFELLNYLNTHSENIYMCMYILNSDFQNHTPVYTARLKWLLEFLLIKQNPLSLQNMLPFRTSSAPQQEGSMHSSDPPSPALLERGADPTYYSGFSKYTFRFSFYKGFLWDSTVPLVTLELHPNQEMAAYHPLP